jgi:hypothetical protein
LFADKFGGQMLSIGYRTAVGGNVKLSSAPISGDHFGCGLRKHLHLIGLIEKALLGADRREQVLL